jgi:hypothetical protein
MRCSTLLLLLPLASALQFAPSRTPLARRARASLRLSEAAPPDEPEGSGLPSDEELMASFKNRLDAEGGATQFRLRTDAQNAADTVKSGLDGVKNKVGSLLDVQAPSGKDQGLLEQGQWRTLVIFFGLTLALSVFTALNTPKGELSSDGTQLEFGVREPYRPTLG